MEKKFKIKNSDGDFLQVQNYVLELVSEKKISQSAFILYCFYRSLAGFSEIRCGYEYISLNSGLSKGSITNGNKLLIKNNLIEITNHGYNRSFEIDIISGSSLPRRSLKKVDRTDREVYVPKERSIDEQPVQQMNAEKVQRSESEQINISNKYSSYKYNTTAAEAALNKLGHNNTTKYHSFLEEFADYYCDQYNIQAYRKKDFKKLLDIEDPTEAIKYIPVLWSLDESDKWIRNSDHSLSIFVKEYSSGRLQTYYPQTKHYYKDRQKESKINTWNRQSQ